MGGVIPLCLLLLGDGRSRESVDNRPASDQSRSEERSKDEGHGRAGGTEGSGKQILLPLPNH